MFFLTARVEFFHEPWREWANFGWASFTVKEKSLLNTAKIFICIKESSMKG